MMKNKMLKKKKANNEFYINISILYAHLFLMCAYSVILLYFYSILSFPCDIIELYGTL